jgi:hypothetical protein
LFVAALTNETWLLSRSPTTANCAALALAAAIAAMTATTVARTAE